MGNLRGRIIQAYFNGSQVVIYKTELFHFAPLERARSLIDIFVRYMASTPIGNTRDPAATAVLAAFCSLPAGRKHPIADSLIKHSYRAPHQVMGGLIAQVEMQRTRAYKVFEPGEIFNP